MGTAIRLSIVLISALFAAASTVEPEYEVTCETVECPNASDVSTYSAPGYASYTCIWHCVDYNGASGVYVAIDFVSNGGCWHKDSEYVSSGICD